MSKNVTIARLNTLVTANASQFTKEMGKASAIAKSRGKSIHDALSTVGGALGVGLSVGAAVAFGKSIVDLGSQITDLSSVADMSARNFQTLSVLAGDSGVKMEEVAKASETMRQRLQDAKDNASDPLNASLRKLGLSAQGVATIEADCRGGPTAGPVDVLQEVDQVGRPQLGLGHRLRIRCQGLQERQPRHAQRRDRATQRSGTPRAAATYGGKGMRAAHRLGTAGGCHVAYIGNHRPHL